MWKVCALLVLVSGLSVVASTSSVYAITQEECEDLVKKVQSGEMTKEEAMAMKEECRQYSEGTEPSEEQRAKMGERQGEPSEEQRAKMGEQKTDNYNKMDKNEKTQYRKELSEKSKSSMTERFQGKSEEMSEDQRKEISEKYKQMKEENSQDRKSYVDMTEDEIQKLREQFEQERIDKEIRNAEFKNLTEEEKQKLNENLRSQENERRKNMVTPSQQMTMGISSEDIACSPELDLVIRISNGLAACVNPSTAVAMIDRGMAIPA